MREQCLPTSHIFAAGVPCIVYLAAEFFCTMVRNPLIGRDFAIPPPERAVDSFSGVERHGTYLSGVILDR